MARTDKQEEAAAHTAPLAQALEDWLLLAVNKFHHDWTLHLAGMVAFSVLTSLLALLLAVLTVLTMLPSIVARPADLARQIDAILPENVRQQVDIVGLLHAVSSNAGTLTIISIALLLWGGSHLFGAMECAFAVIFRVKLRGFVRQKVMALLMILLFAALLPLSFVSSFLLSATTTTLGTILPSATTGVVAQVTAAITTFVALFVLFLAIYVVVPNLPMHWHYAWRGARRRRHVHLQHGVPLVHGTLHQHQAIRGGGAGGVDHPHRLAVVLLDDPARRRPAERPDDGYRLLAG
jgi:YihY family inner membrane protein